MPSFANRCENFLAHHFGQHQIKYYDVVLSCLAECDRFRAIGCLIDGKACFFKTFADRFANRFVILSNEYSHNVNRQKPAFATGTIAGSFKLQMVWCMFVFRGAADIF